MITRPAGIAVLALVSFALLYLLVSHAGLSWSAAVSSIADLGLAVFLSVLALTGANLALGTVKWLLVMRAFAPDSKAHAGFVDGMLTTTLGALLGQVMPVQAGVALTRSVAGRMGVGRSPGINLGTTAYEQLFDAIVLGFAGVAGLCSLMLRPGVAGWLLLALFFGSAGMLAVMQGRRLLAASSEWLAHSRFADSRFSKLGVAAGRAAQLPAVVLMQLTVLSLLRYLAVLSRAAIVLGALGLWAVSMPAILAFPLVQVIGFLPLTPGNLGVIEGTWSGVLVYAGATLNAAVLFAVTLRVVNVAAQAILLGLFAAIRLLPRVSAA